MTEVKLKTEFECEWDEPVFSAPQTISVRATCFSSEDDLRESSLDALPELINLEVYMKTSKGHLVGVDPIPAGLATDLLPAARERMLANKDVSE